MSEDAAATLEARSLGHRYRGGPWVLRALDARWAYGSVAAVTGANGAGKSTLLRLLAGVVRPREGAVLGRPTRVAYVPERLAAPTLGTQRWLAAMASVRGTSPAAAGDVLAVLGGRVPAGAPLSALSKGTVRKVLLAEALASPCRLLVLDEPWADLDAASADALGALLRARAGRGALVVLSDHTGRAAGVDGGILALGDASPATVAVATYTGPADGIPALDEAAGRLGFRRG